MHVVLGITGASGMIYAVRLLGALDCRKSIILSNDGEKVLRMETGLSARDIRARTDHFYRNDQMGAPLASGSRAFDAMVICPCSMSTAAKVGCGIADNLITRTASVALKERRRLVIVPRETPVSTVQLRNLTALSEAGAVILPASPAFYGKPRSIEELADFIAGRVLDVIGVENRLYRRWAD